MRQIKFRGKDIETGEWLYGYLVQPIGQNPSIYVQDVKTEGVASFFVYDVEESTVGQFTELLDKNENEIYDGDIVKAPLLDPIFRDILKDAFTEAVVKYNNGAFVVSYYNESHNIYIQDLYEKIEVIGNIHDNTDILDEKR